MQDAEAYYKQEQNIKYVSDSYGKESWVRVSGKDILNGAEAHFWCALIKKTKVKSVFRDFSWDTDAPYYFTPVFFKKEVLQKYILKKVKATSKLL